VVDLSVHVGDMVKAIANVGFSRPLMCIGLCETAGNVEFVKTEVVHFLKAKLLSEDGFNIPGFTIPPKDVTMDEITVPAPALSALKWCDNSVMITDADRAKWSEHDTFQAQFNELDAAIQQAVSTCSIGHIKPDHVKEEALGGHGEPPHKKQRSDGGGEQAPDEPLKLIDASSISDVVVDVQIVPHFSCGRTKRGSSNLVLKICSNHALYLVNTAAADAGNNGNDGQREHGNDGCEKLMHGSVLVGYGRGKWQQENSGDARQIRYALQSSKDFVIFNGQLNSLGNVVSAKRLSSDADSARCCYHEMVDDPKDDDKSAFFLRATQEIYYVLQDVPLKQEGGKAAAASASALQSNAGSLIPLEAWNTEFTKMQWIVKWQPKKGLQPVRPQITWMGPDTTIPSGKALQLTP
jgi:hypothetical protein